MGKKPPHRSDRDYRAIVESQSGLLCRFKRDGTITYVNPACADMRDQKVQDLIGSNLWDLMGPEQSASVRARVDHVTSASPQLVFEERVVQEGLDHWILWTLAGIEFGVDDQATSFQSWGVDITERKQAEMALAESEARLHLALEAANAGVWTLDLKTGKASVSAELAPLYGYPVDMFPNYERWIARVHPDDQERLQNGLDKYLNTGGVQFQHEFRIIHPQMGVRWILDIGRVERDQEGKATRLYGINMDITERKRAEETLRESETKFRELAEALPTVVWATTADGRPTYVNRSWISFTGCPLEQVQAMDWRDFIHPDDQCGAGPLWGKSLGENGCINGEARLRRFDGEYRWHYFKMIRLLSETASGSGWYGASMDIHEHWQLEQAMRDSEGLFHMIADMAPIMLWITEADGSSSFLSKGWYDFSGLSPEQATGWGWIEVIHPDDRDRAVHGFEEATKARADYELDYRMRRADGEYRWVLDRGRPRFSPTGDFLGHIGSIVDIHERSQAEEGLRESEERFRTLADNMSQLAWMADKEGQLVWFNRRWYEFTGSSEPHSLNWGWVKFLHPEYRRAVIKRIQHSWDTGEKWEDTFPLRSKTGRYHWFLSRAMPIRDEHNVITRWFGTHTDVTAQRYAEDALRHANERKNEFLATLAHELRNPLAPLRNGLEIMQLAADDPEAIENARGMMQRQLEHMVRLIDDLLDLSRISRGKIRLSKQRIPLTDVIAQAVETSRTKIEAEAVDFHLKMPAENCYVYGDATRLGQVFANLLNNAAKFTQRGGDIWLSVEVQGNTALICVRDTGIGMPPELVPEVFEMFAQGERGLESAQGGLGVGLSLVKGLVELHGGSVTAYSEGPGKGSEFTVTLPLVEAPEEVAAMKREPSALNGQHHHVLVVDDNPDSATSMATMLELLGNEARTAHDGLQALAEAATYRPDIILLDIGMPKLNGYEVAKRLRQEEWGKDMLLVALTGWGQEEDRRRSRAAGFDYHLVKPADLTDIQDVLRGRVPKTR